MLAVPNFSPRINFFRVATDGFEPWSSGSTPGSATRFAPGSSSVDLEDPGADPEDLSAEPVADPGVDDPEDLSADPAPGRGPGR